MEKDSLNIYLEEIGRNSLLTDIEENELGQRIIQGDQAAMKKLVTANLRFVVSMAKQYRDKGVDFEDLICEGNMGLMKAATKYPRQNGKRFVVFAAPYVRQAMEKAIGIEEQAEAKAYSNEESLHAAEDQDDKEMMELISRSLGFLDDRQRRIITAIYGIGVHVHTMAEIGEEMGLKRERIRQIRDKAIRTLCKKDKGLKSLMKKA